MTITFRLALESDAAGVQAIYAPFCEASVISFETTAPSVEEMARRIRTVSERHPWLVCLHDSQIMGYVYASPHRDRAAYQWSVDVAVYIAEAAHRRGVGRGLYTSLFRILILLGYFLSIPDFGEGRGA